MGAIRGILLVFVAVFFFLSILTTNLFWIMSSSLNYENVQKESASIAQDFLKDIDITNIVKQAYPFISLHCKNNSYYLFNYQGYALDIPCTIVSQGIDAIIGEGVRDIIYGVYYADYDCSFLDCSNKAQLPLFLISEKAHDFFSDKLYFSLIASVIFFVLIFLLVEKKTNTLILSGSIIIISSLPFLKLEALWPLLPGQLLFKFLKIFFSQSYFVSIKVLIIGVAILLLGIVFDIFKIGFSISNLINKTKEQKKDKKKSK